MATTISLGDPASSFKVFSPRGQPQYKQTQTKFYSEERTITGALDRLESNIFETRYQLTIMAASADVVNLKTLYAKVNAASSLNKLQFIDLTGIQWSPSSASGAGVITNTGVYFDGSIVITPNISIAWSNAKFLVGIELVAIATGLSSS